MARPRSSVGQVLESMKGLSLQELRPEYAGEDKQVGWRTDLKPRDQKEGETAAEYAEYLRRRSDPVRSKAFRESDQTVTKYYDDAEREKGKVSFDEQGRAVGGLSANADGTMLDAKGVIARKPGAEEKVVEYVADAQGTLHQFAPGVRPTGQKMTSPITDKEVVKSEATHHSSVLAGGAVSAAGEIKLDYAGYVTEITNKSGHYKPGATQVIQLLEELAKQGALLDKGYLMPDANGMAQPLAGKAKEIHEAIAKVQAALERKIADGKSVEPDLAAIEKGKQALAKLGAAPANRFRDVKVEFLAGAEKKTGADVRNTAGTRTTAEEFMRTGGGAVADVKKVEKTPVGPMPSAFGASNLDYDTYPRDVVAKRLGISEAELHGVEEGGVLFPGDLLRDDHLRAKIGVNSLEELYAKITGGAGAVNTRMVTTTRRVDDLKDRVLGELKGGRAAPGRPKTLQDADSDARADALPAKIKASMERLPQVLAWYRSELKKAESDHGPEAAQRRKELAAGIARVEAAMKPTDVSEAGLAKVLSDLEAQFERVRREPPA
jgi:hypothetical protein